MIKFSENLIKNKFHQKIAKIPNIKGSNTSVATMNCAVTYYQNLEEVSWPLEPKSSINEKFSKKQLKKNSLKKC